MADKTDWELPFKIALRVLIEEGGDIAKAEVALAGQMRSELPAVYPAQTLASLIGGWQETQWAKALIGHAAAQLLRAADRVLEEDS